MLQEEKSGGNRTTLMRTELISDMITSHARKVGYMMPNERFEVKDVEVSGDVSEVTGEIHYLEVQ